MTLEDKLRGFHENPSQIGANYYEEIIKKERYIFAHRLEERQFSKETTNTSVAPCSSEGAWSPTESNRKPELPTKIRPPRFGGKGLTLIIGMRASDGVVLASDRKVMRGGEAHYSNKIYELEEVLFAAEGYTGVADDFLLLLRHEVSLKKGFGSLYEARILAEDVVAELTDRYSERLSSRNMVGLLMAGLEDLTSGPAKLYYIHSSGYGETVSFRCSGSGGDYATTLAKFLHDQAQSVEENARRAAFVIHWVSEDVDTHVGGTPQVAMVKDQQNSICWLAEGEIEEQKKKVDRVRAELWERLCTPLSRSSVGSS